jgi:hypothetical protein
VILRSGQSSWLAPSVGDSASRFGNCVGAAPQEAVDVAEPNMCHQDNGGRYRYKQDQRSCKVVTNVFLNDGFHDCCSQSGVSERHGGIRPPQIASSTMSKPESYCRSASFCAVTSSPIADVWPVKDYFFCGAGEFRDASNVGAI